MRSKLSFCVGAAIGFLVALIIILNYKRQIIILPLDASIAIDFLSTYVCPLWWLGFTSLIKSDVELFIVVVLSNIIVYGLGAVFCRACFRLLKSIGRIKTGSS